VIDERLGVLSDRVKQIEEHVQTGPAVQQALETRVDATEIRMREALAEQAAIVQRDLGAITARLTDVEQAQRQGQVQDTIANLNRRFEFSERRSKDALTTLQSGLSDAAERIARLEEPESEYPTPPSQDESSPLLLEEVDAEELTSEVLELEEQPGADTDSREDYLAQARRAAQAAADPSTASVWQIPAGRTRERSRVARVVTQGFFLLLVMCTGFLLMQYFGPQPGPVVRSPTSLLNVPELRELAARANQGIPGAELLLGLKYADGDGIEVNDAEAARWLERAAQKGEALAQYRLGTLYEKGLGVTADPTVAADWYEKAAGVGNVKAMHNLAVAYANGVGRETNYPAAARWFRAAAERGLPDSQFNLAVLHERGLGVPTSLSEAYKWYAIAGEQGDTEASARVEALLSQIPAAERDAVDQVASQFKAAPSNPTVNEPPQLSQVLN
jgi:TPR repeat protein